MAPDENVICGELLDQGHGRQGDVSVAVPSSGRSPPGAIFTSFGMNSPSTVTRSLCAFITSRMFLYGFDLVLQLRRVAAAQNVLRNKIRLAPRGFTERDAEPEKIFGVNAPTDKNCR